MCCEERCLLITVWSCKRQQTGVLSGQLIIGREGCGNGILPPEQRGVPTHSFKCTCAERHPQADSGLRVICECVCMCVSPLRFTTTHLSRGQDSKMTRLTALLWLVSDRNISLASIWGPWTLRSLFVSSCNPWFGDLSRLNPVWRGKHLTGLKCSLLLHAKVARVHLEPGSLCFFVHRTELREENCAFSFDSHQDDNGILYYLLRKIKAFYINWDFSWRQINKIRHFYSSLTELFLPIFVRFFISNYFFLKKIKLNTLKNSQTNKSQLKSWFFQSPTQIPRLCCNKLILGLATVNLDLISGPDSPLQMSSAQVCQPSAPWSHHSLQLPVLFASHTSGAHE